MNGSNSLYIGKPSEQLQTAGFSEAPFAMNQSDYRKSRRESAKNSKYSSHAVPYDFFESMPQYMSESPIIIDNGKKATVVTSYEMKDTRGKDSYVIAGVLRNQTMESDTVNLVKSAYPLDDFVEQITKAAESGKLVVTNKNKAEQMLATIGIQPSEVSRIINLANGILSQTEPNVNTPYSLSAEDTNAVKQKQLEIIQETNPAYSDSFTWIRKVEDIHTLEETLSLSSWAPYDEFDPDLTKADILKAIESGKITVYSSHPIENGAFVTPSRMEAESYAGDGKVYQKTVDINNVAWIDPTQGQYAEINTDTKYSLSAEQEAYFKDSKVRDENGNLKVMYHGTSKGGHTVFDTYGSNYGLFGTGTYFTDNKSVAESYTKKGKGNNPQVYESYLNITNPMDMDAQANPEEWRKAFPDAIFRDSGTNEQFYRDMENWLEDEMYPKWEAAEIAIDGLQGMGYDGITHIGGGRVNADGLRHQVYIAFEPEQIKNIDNLEPTTDADIRYSLKNNLENVDKILYDNNNPLAIVNRAKSKNNSSIKWVYESEIFSVTENKKFHEKISEINRGSQAFEKNSRGEYMLPIDNKIVFTNGNYESPYIREIIEVLTEYQTEFEEIRGQIFDVEKGKSSKQEAVRTITQVFGNGNIVTYRSGNNGVYDWQNGQRKGKTRRTVIRNYLNKQYRAGNDNQIQETKVDSYESAFSISAEKVI